jgi:peptidyl-tRNA hydrolase, PTH1 family
MLFCLICFKVKYLIIGLGNIGAEYANTRHNIGFQVIDHLVKDENVLFKTERFANVAQIKYKGRILVLCKPTTYMNLSGKAVNYWLQKENIPIENLLIVVDDLALSFGTIRIKKKGSDAGHNGLNDIITTLGHNEFNRLRFGIGNEFSRGAQIDFVLGGWSEEDQKLLPERLDKMCEAIKSFVTIGIDRTMNYFNGK